MSILGIIKFNSFIKFLGKNKLYTFIEIFGLSVSLMFVILIANFTFQEFTTDRFHNNSDRLYLLANESFGFANKLGDRIKERYPEIEEVCHIVETNSFNKLSVNISDVKYNANVLFTDQSFFTIFSFDLKQGDRSRVFEAKTNAVITESFAHRAFPNKDPLGQIIHINDELVVTVSGIMKDIHHSVVPNGDILIRFDNIGKVSPPMDSDNFDYTGIVPIFFMVSEGADISSKGESVLAYLKEILWTYQRGIDTKISFVPIADAYFSDIAGDDLIQQGDRRFVLILLSVGILVLIFAVINYINLAVAQAGFRAKEMATRKLLGSSRLELFLRLIMESFLLCVFSFLISLFLAFLMLPYANNLLQTSINLNGMFTPIILFISFCTLLFIALLAGLVPAIMISKAKPIEVVKGSFKQQNKMVFSKFFITFQNMITIAMVAASITMAFQTNHLIKAPLGYNTQNIINIDVSTLGDKQQMLTLANELDRLSVVKRTAFSMGTPFVVGNNVTMEYNGRNLELRELVGDSTFFSMLGFEVMQENYVSGGDAAYLTEQAAKVLEVSENDPSFPFFDIRRPLSGIIRDFQLQNIAYANTPAIVKVDKFDNFYPWNMTVEVQGDPYYAMNEVKKIYERITPFEFEGKFMDQQIQESFIQQIRTSKIIIIFSVIAILLSILGLTAMASFFIQQRSREIAVRKVFGSNNPEVLKRLIRMFLSYVIIAFVIVTPVIWYLMYGWLSGYIYRISLSPWIFISAGGFCLVISFFTVFWQSYQAACMNPVVSIKAE